MNQFKPPAFVRAPTDGANAVTRASDVESGRPVKRARSDPFAAVSLARSRLTAVTAAAAAPGSREEEFLVPAVPRRAKTSEPKKDALQTLMAKNKLAKAVQLGGDYDYVFRNVFGKSDYKGQQKQVMAWAVEGKDVLVIAPTGMGKSLCFQVPAIAVTHGLTLVVGPLISLMQDQVRALKGLEIPAEMLTSKTTKAAQKAIYKDMESGHPKNRLLYITPERLSSPHFDKRLKILYQQKELSRLVIDEAHCISEWGHDFRPDYAKLGNFRLEYPSVPIMALTASATAKVQTDILSNLRLDSSAQLAVHGVNRENLFYEIRYFSESEKSAFWKMEDLARTLIKFSTEKKTKQVTATAGIVYCRAKHTCDEVAAYLTSQGICAGAYHRGLKDSEANWNQERWINNVELAEKGKSRIDCIVATIAFGMGIDKPDCRYVVHYDIPKSFEGYYQETGRAGRDGLAARCVMYFSLEDSVRAKNLVERGHDRRTKRGEQGKAAFPSQRAPDSIDALLKFAKSASTCRHASICKYFGETVTVANKADSDLGQVVMCDKDGRVVCAKMCDVCRDPEKTRKRRKEGLVDLDESMMTQHFHQQTQREQIEQEEEEEDSPYADDEVAQPNAILDDSSSDDDSTGSDGDDSGARRPMAGFQSAAAMMKGFPPVQPQARLQLEIHGKGVEVDEEPAQTLETFFARSAVASALRTDDNAGAEDAEDEEEPPVAQPLSKRTSAGISSDEEEDADREDNDTALELIDSASSSSDDDDNDDGEGQVQVQDAIERVEYPDDAIPDDILFEDDAEDEEAAAQLLHEVVASQMPPPPDDSPEGPMLPLPQLVIADSSSESDDELPELARRPAAVSQRPSAMIGQSSVRLAPGVISNNSLVGAARPLGALSNSALPAVSQKQTSMTVNENISHGPTASQQERIAIDAIDVSPATYEKKIAVLLRRKTVMHFFKCLKRKLLPAAASAEHGMGSSSSGSRTMINPDDAAAAQAIWTRLSCASVEPAEKMKILRSAADELESDLFWLSVTQAGYTRGVSQRTAAFEFLFAQDEDEIAAFFASPSTTLAVDFSARQLDDRRKEAIEAVDRAVDHVLPKLRRRRHRDRDRGHQGRESKQSLS